jgi:hypothetical protein
MARYAGIFAAHARGRHALTGRGMRHRSAPPPSASAPSAPAVDGPGRSSKQAGDPHHVGDRAPGDPHHVGDRAPEAVVGPADPGRGRRLEWSKLMARAWKLDVLRCPRCDGRMRLVALVEDAVVARRILEHVGLPTRAPPPGRPWTPQPQLRLDEVGPAFDADPPSAF